jgi:hypothetical protein
MLNIILFSDDVLYQICSNIINIHKDIINLILTHKIFSYKLFSNICIKYNFKYLYKFNNLIKLDLYFTCFNKLEYITSLKYLNTLNLGCCYNIKDFSYLYELTNLKNLNLNNSSIKNITYLPLSLIYLNLYNCIFIIEFSHLSKLINLKHLNLNKTKIDNLNSIPKNLKYLYIYNCKNIIDITLINTFPNCNIYGL